MAIEGARSLGVVHCFTSTKDFTAGNPRLNMAFLSQIFVAKNGLPQVSADSVVDYTEPIKLVLPAAVMELALEGETMESLESLPAPVLLLRWLNYHTSTANPDSEPLQSFGDNENTFVPTLEALCITLHQLDSSLCTLCAKNSDDWKTASSAELAAQALAGAAALAIVTPLTAKDLCAPGHRRAQKLAQLASMIFNVKDGLVSSEALLTYSNEVIILAEGDEDIESFDYVSTEQVLLRWLNYHLINSRSNQTVDNFDEDLDVSIVQTLCVYQSLQSNKSVNVHTIEFPYFHIYYDSRQFHSHICPDTRILYYSRKFFTNSTRRSAACQMLTTTTRPLCARYLVALRRSESVAVS